MPGTRISERPTQPSTLLSAPIVPRSRSTVRTQCPRLADRLQIATDHLEWADLLATDWTGSSKSVVIVMCDDTARQQLEPGARVFGKSRSS